MVNVSMNDLIIHLPKVGLISLGINGFQNIGAFTATPVLIPDSASSTASSPELTSYLTYGFQTDADNHNFDAAGVLQTGEFDAKKWTYSNIVFTSINSIYLNFAYDTTNLDTNEPWHNGWVTTTAKEVALEAFESNTAYWLVLKQGDNIIGKIKKSGVDAWSVEYHVTETVNGIIQNNEPIGTRIALRHPYLKVPIAGIEMHSSHSNIKDTLLGKFTGLLQTYQNFVASPFIKTSQNKRLEFRVDWKKGGVSSNLKRLYEFLCKRL